MDKTKLELAELELKESYDYLSEAVKTVTQPLTAKLDCIVADLAKGINLYSNTQLWDFQMQLSVEAFILGSAKEQSALKQACADALYKEGVAKSFSLTTGAQEAKKQQSILDTVDKQAVNMLWTAVSNLLKTKCDEAHRLVNTIQSIQISRAAEAKISGSPRNEQDSMDFNQGE